MSNYNVKTTARTAVPRSKRLREGAAPEGAASTGGGAGGAAAGDCHSHTNKEDLDRIRVEGQYIKVYIDVEQGGEFIKELVLAKAGYADEAGEAAHALEADEAEHALEADHAGEADNADTWDNHQFDDYLDQAVKRESNVEFAKVTVPSVETDDFSSGPFGTGYQIVKKQDGDTYLEIDHIKARKTVEFNELIIQQLKHQGGMVFYTAASLEITEVEEVTDGYKCFFDTKNGQIPNEFAVGDQARCQRFDLASTNPKYYWRLVTEIGTNYVVLSASDCDTESDEPEAGDVIVQLGNRSDSGRQSAIVMATVGDNAPSQIMYAGINSYSLASKDVYGVVNRQTQSFCEPYLYDYGSMRFGGRVNSDDDYLDFDKETGRLSIKGTIVFNANVFDASKKEDVKTRWENINGQATTDPIANSTKGTYWTVKANFDRYIFPNQGCTFEYQGVVYTYDQRLIVYALIGLSDLDTKYTALRTYLAGIGLYSAGDSSNYNRTAMALMFTEYLDAERNVSDKIVIDSKDKVDDMTYLKALLAKEGGSTELAAGVILSNIIAVRNADDIVVAGMNGSPSVSSDRDNGTLMFFAGAPTSGSLTQRLAQAAFRVYEDGSVYASKMTIKAVGTALEEGGIKYSLWANNGIRVNGRAYIDQINALGQDENVVGSVKMYQSSPQEVALYPNAQLATRVDGSGSSMHGVLTLKTGTADINHSGASIVLDGDTIEIFSGLPGGKTTIFDGGVFCGLRANVREIYSSTTLDEHDDIIIVHYGATITFPATPAFGQRYRIYCNNPDNVTLSRISGANYYYYNPSRTSMDGKVMDFVYAFGEWHVMRYE